MTIASKLYFFQRHRSERSSPPDARELRPLSPPRRPRARSRSDDHRGIVSTQYRNRSSSNFLQNSRRFFINDEDSRIKDESVERLPDSVKQARERLLLRLRSINLSGGSRQTDIDLENQQIMRRSQSDGVHSFCEFTKRPTILDLSQVINGLKSIIFRPANECEIMGTSFVECCICLDKFIEGEKLTQLNCKHTFHSRCLTRWVQAHSDCPYCRAPVA